jgi:hypothetical protein
VRLLRCAVLTCTLISATAVPASAIEPAGELAALHQRIVDDVSAGGALRVHVYVALCDNDSQGIVPVKNRSICDGEAPEQNIYWRSSGGIASYLSKQRYRQLEYTLLPDGPIAIRARYAKELPAGAALRARGVARVPVELTALAYRGAQIGPAMFDFVRAVHEAPAVASDAPHMVGYIGHDYFLDDYDPLELKRARAGSSRVEQAVFALSCLGQRYIRPAIERPNAHILVLNRGLTYPGAWTVGGLIAGLARGDSHAAIHRLAARAFADGMKKPYSTMLRAFAPGP